MIIGIGVDVVHVYRLKRWEKIPGLFQRFFHEAELGSALPRGEAGILSLAARFAAKEAVMKVLGTGVRGVGWHDIEILSDERGKPVVLLHGRASERASTVGIGSIAVSLSDSKEYAVAVALGN